MNTYIRQDNSDNGYDGRSSSKWLGHILLLLVTVLFAGATAKAAVVAADGGITLWISYDNLDQPGLMLSTAITQVDRVQTTGGNGSSVNCDLTNGARATQGAEPSLGSCPTDSGDDCPGEAKLRADIEKFARYIYVSTQGAHYLRRVYVADQGRAWTTADVRWNAGGGISIVPTPGSWVIPGEAIHLNSSLRKCIHDVLHHEFGHYFYDLPDRYDEGGGYYQGIFDVFPRFDVEIVSNDRLSVMSGNFPHRFVDWANAWLEVSYAGVTETLRPSLLTDNIPGNDGPNRSHHGFTTPFARDEWSLLPSKHIDLEHTIGNFNEPNLSSMPPVDLRVLEGDDSIPGIALLLDRSGSMAVTTHGLPASQFVQEAGLYLYHTSREGDFVGTYLYNALVEEQFDYGPYASANLTQTVQFENASGSTDISRALKTAIDDLILAHGIDSVNGGQIILMSDGKQTVGNNLWIQVDRARNLGIQIHTMSFGDADILTMAQIASNSGGDATVMSGSVNAAELKLDIARKVTTLRNNTPIYSLKDRVTKTGEVDGVEFFESKFQAPPRTRDLLFYVFLEKGNAADLNIELSDSAGNVFESEDQNLARNGRFSGIRVIKARPGQWSFKVTAADGFRGKMPVNDSIEIVAYAEDREMQARTWFDDEIDGYPRQRIIRASLNYRYPLTNMKVQAIVYDGDKRIRTIDLFDNGKQGIDSNGNDGVFSGLLDLGSLGLSAGGPKKSIRVDVEFAVSKDTVPARNVPYEAGAAYKTVVDDYRNLGLVSLNAYSSQTTRLRLERPRVPLLRMIQPGGIAAIGQGKKGEIEVIIANGRPSIDQLRVSLGQGIYAFAASVESNKSGFGSRIKILYRVGPSADPGSRKLSLQYGNTRLYKENAISVQAGN